MLTLEFVAHEMAVQLRLTDEELQFASLPCSFAFLLFNLRAIGCFLVLTLTDITFFLLVFLPEHKHLAHKTLAFCLHIFGRFGGTVVRSARL
jgi:hypothetical protein